MRVIGQARQLAPGDRPVCVALGMFDGVHLGHQSVLNHTVESAADAGAVSVAITFDQHPNVVVAPTRTPSLIYSLPQRLRAIEWLGLETLLLIHFDEEFSRQSGQEFITRLVNDFGRVHSICVGASFTFGHKRSGNVALLRALGDQFGFTVQALPPVLSDGLVVSSTRIRGAIQKGDLTAASRMLGRGYSIAGAVIKGERLGRELGFPTANLDVAGLALPPAGVYAGQALANGKAWRAVMNIGHRPTLNRPASELRAEVHLLSFEGDLYGQELEFRFIENLRGERKFASLDALKAQIARDVRAAETAVE
jgi:riboflavin kinase/FMN adenylyltransferase